MKHLNPFARIMWATLITVAMLVYAGCYNDAPNPWYNTQENTGGNSNNSNKTPGSQEDTSGSTQQDPNYKQGYSVSFKMPEGWRYNPASSRGNDQIIIDQPSSDGIKPYVFMDLHWSGVGDEAKAKKFAQENYDESFPWIDDSTNKEYKPYFKDIEVDGIKVYIAGDINIAWGFPSWCEDLYFSHDGIIYHIGLEDITDKHMDAVKTIIQSIKRNN